MYEYHIRVLIQLKNTSTSIRNEYFSVYHGSSQVTSMGNLMVLISSSAITFKKYYHYQKYECEYFRKYYIWPV